MLMESSFDMDLFPSSENFVPLEFWLGNDVLTGEFNRETQKASQAAYANFSKAVFSIGEKADGKIYSTYRPSDSEAEVYLKLEIDGADNTISKTEDGVWSFVSPRLSTQGQHTISSSLFLQNKREASVVEASVKALNDEIYRIDDKLKRETDPEVISELTKRRQDLLSKIAALEYNLEKLRTPIGNPSSEVFYSN
jgi:hypothetical protein